MNPSLHQLLRGIATLGLSALFASAALADDAAIRKSVAEHYPSFPKIDEITKTPITGLYEIRIGRDVMYIDETGGTIVQGHLVDARTRTDLTEERIEKLTAIDFKTLPLKDAMVWKQGNGSRKLVVFADPNCVYCKKLERELQSVKDVTVYTFLYPILGSDSPEKSKAIWCAKDSTQAWRDWMINGVTPPVTTACDTSAITRNMALGTKHRITGTPGIVFENGRKQPGALDALQIDQMLATSKVAATSLR